MWIAAVLIDYQLPSASRVGTHRRNRGTLAAFSLPKRLKTVIQLKHHSALSIRTAFGFVPAARLKHALVEKLAVGAWPQTLHA